MKYYLIAGEASGDLHGANLMKGLKETDAQADFRYYGGNLMSIQGGVLVKHFKEMAFMGFLTVLLNIRTILKNIKKCKKDIIAYNPDVIILIDYPGFNLEIAKFAKKNKIKVFYYISPKIWAWKESRIKSIKKNVDKMFVIFPFEKDFYKKHDYKVDFAGNPLVDAIEERENKDESFQQFITRNNLPNKPIIALLAGSRKQEIKNILPVMLEITNDYPEYQFVIAAAPSIDYVFYDNLIRDKKISLLYDQTYEILQQSKAALVASGTATLETALLNIPQIVCYKFFGGGLFYNFIKRFLKVPYVSLVNLIMDSYIVKEIIQQHLNYNSLKAELNNILHNTDYRNEMLEKYNMLNTKLGGPGASKRFASLMYNELTKKS